MVEVEGSTSEKVESASDLLYLSRRGTECRTTTSTQMNLDSSRSHLVTSMVTQIVNKRTGCKTLGKLTLAALAGSERISKGGATGSRLKGAQFEINNSLDFAKRFKISQTMLIMKKKLQPNPGIEVRTCFE